MKPLISIVIVGFDMKRELPRTVTSFSAPYQTGLSHEDIEIILVDNNSAEPVQRDWFDPDINLKVLRVTNAGVSPCRAINEGVRACTAQMIGIVIDGARMATPGALSTALTAMRTTPRAFVATLGFHLGPEVQQSSVLKGYSRDVEDDLLRDIGWPSDGYRLFEICALGESYRNGVLASPTETTFFVMDKDQYWQVGAYNEAFVSLGGGFASFDFFERAIAAAGEDFIMLVGEGTFHQLHYGATTQAGGVRREVAKGRSLGDVYAGEYEQILGHAYAHRPVTPALYGRLLHSSAHSYFFPVQ